MQRPRDRSRREREHVDLEPQRAQKLLLGDAEALLLVEHDEAEILRDDVAREDAVRADEDVDLAGLELLEDPLLVGSRAEARHHLDGDREVPVALAERVPVLLRQDRRRTEDERLLAVQRDRESGANRDLRLPEADVSAHQPIHRPRGLEILLDGLDRLLLVLRLAVRERALEPLEPVAREVECLARRLLAPGVQGEQLTGELAHGRARTALEVLPGLPAELRQRGRARIRADVPRHLRELLVRDVQAVLSPEGEEQVVARDAGHVLRLEPEQATDTVVLVHDVVAHPQVGERLQCAPESRIRPRRPLAEDLGVGQKGDAELAPDESAARRADHEVQRRVRGQRCELVVDGCRDPTQEPLRAQRLPAMRKRHDDSTTLPQHPGELVLGLGEATRGDRRPLSLEHVCLGARQRVEPRGPLGRLCLEPLLLPDAHDVVELPDEVGSTVEEGNATLELGGSRSRRRATPGRDPAGAPAPGRRPPRRRNGGRAA